MSRADWATVASTSARTGGADENGESTVTARNASARRRSRGGSTWTTFDSAETDASDRAPELIWAAPLSATAMAIASSSSTVSGGIVAPAPSWYPPSEPAHRVDRVAQLTQPLDVPSQGPLRHLEPAGQLRSRPEPVRLQQREQTKGPRAGVRHGSRMPHHQVKKWPHCSVA